MRGSVRHACRPNLWHQDLAHDLAVIFDGPIKKKGRSWVLENVNVSDRGEDWERNYRIPDVVVVLKSGRAVHCGTHWFGGPDFVVEIDSRKEKAATKLDFYSGIGVRELLIIDRDRRTLRLYRHNGQQLVLAARSSARQPHWLSSEVLPLGFRWRKAKAGPRTEVKRTGKKPRSWTL